MNYSQAVTELEARGIMPDRPPNLEPMKKGLSLLFPKECFQPDKTIVVAGTNGKGTICATLEALFISAGETVGIYTSPHLEETVERIRIQGKPLSKDHFVLAYQHVVERVKSIESDKLRLSHFEVLTLMAAWIFFSGEIIPPVQRPIFEVGLGGTWDATNAIPHQNCVIASLSLDHQNLLGNSLFEIAMNKFGIISEGANVVYSPLPKEVIPLARQIQLQTRSTWTEAVSVSLEIDSKNQPPRFLIHTPWGKASLAMAGTRAALNAATALTLFEKCGYNPHPHLNALSNVQWPGRMECFEHSSLPCPIYLSGDHNPAGILSLLELLPHYRRKHLYILVGIGKHKDLGGILEPLLSLPETSVFLTQSPFQGRSLADYDSYLNQVRGTNPVPRAALETILSKANSQDLILVTGSLYLVGAIKQILREL